MGSGKELTGQEVSTRFKKDTARAVRRLMDQGWTVKEKGHGGRAYCPHPECPSSIPISSTPRDDTRHGKWIIDRATDCGHFTRD